MTYINKTIKANRSGALAKVIDENETHIIVTYMTSFKGTFKYPKKAIEKWWTITSEDL